MQLGDVPAGGSVDCLAFGCIDEIDRPVAEAVRGKVMCGWMRKARTAAIEGDCSCVMLPKLKVPPQVRLRPGLRQRCSPALACMLFAS